MAHFEMSTFKKIFLSDELYSFVANELAAVNDRIQLTDKHDLAPLRNSTPDTSSGDQGTESKVSEANLRYDSVAISRCEFPIRGKCECLLSVRAFEFVKMELKNVTEKLKEKKIIEMNIENTNEYRNQSSSTEPRNSINIKSKWTSETPFKRRIHVMKLHSGNYSTDVNQNSSEIEGSVELQSNKIASRIYPFKNEVTKTSNLKKIKSNGITRLEPDKKLKSRNRKCHRIDNNDKHTSNRNKGDILQFGGKGTDSESNLSYRSNCNHLTNQRTDMSLQTVYKKSNKEPLSTCIDNNARTKCFLKTCGPKFRCSSLNKFNSKCKEGGLQNSQQLGPLLETEGSSKSIVTRPSLSEGKYGYSRFSQNKNNNTSRHGKNKKKIFQNHSQRAMNYLIRNESLNEKYYKINGNTERNSNKLNSWSDVQSMAPVQSCWSNGYSQRRNFKNNKWYNLDNRMPCKNYPPREKLTWRREKDVDKSSNVKHKRRNAVRNYARAKRGYRFHVDLDDPNTAATMQYSRSWISSYNESRLAAVPIDVESSNMWRWSNEVSTDCYPKYDCFSTSAFDSEVMHFNELLFADSTNCSSFSRFNTMPLSTSSPNYASHATSSSSPCRSIKPPLPTSPPPALPPLPLNSPPDSPEKCKSSKGLPEPENLISLNLLISQTNVTSDPALDDATSDSSIISPCSSDSSFETENRRTMRLLPQKFRRRGKRFSTTNIKPKKLTVGPNSLTKLSSNSINRRGRLQLDAQLTLRSILPLASSYKQSKNLNKDCCYSCDSSFNLLKDPSLILSLDEDFLATELNRGLPIAQFGVKNLNPIQRPLALKCPEVDEERIEQKNIFLVPVLSEDEQWHDSSVCTVKHVISSDEGPSKIEETGNDSPGKFIDHYLASNSDVKIKTDFDENTTKSPFISEIPDVFTISLSGDDFGHPLRGDSCHNANSSQEFEANEVENCVDEADLKQIKQNRREKNFSTPVIEVRP